MEPGFSGDSQMIKFLKNFFISVFILLPLAGAAAILWWTLQYQPQPPAAAPSPPPVETPQPLNIIRASRLTVTPRLIAYGKAQPAGTLQTTATVQGAIVYFNPQLHPGNVVEKDTLLLRICPKEYELALAKADAQVLRIRAELEQIDQQVKNDHLSMEIEKASLVIAARNLDRSRRLLDKGATSQAEVDSDERKVLQQESVVQNIQNRLSVAASVRKAKEAQLAAAHVTLAQAEHDLACTSIKASETAVIAEVFVRNGQFVATNQPLMESYLSEKMEIRCTLTDEKIRSCLDKDTVERLSYQMRSDIHSQNLAGLFDVDVAVDCAPGTQYWQANLKAAQCNSTEDSITFYLTLQNTANTATPEQIPPLLKGTACKVQLKASAVYNQLVLPASAVHGNVVFVLDQENRCRKRTIGSSFRMGDMIAIDHGLEPGQRVVLSDTTPIEGMLIKPIENDLPTETLANAEIPNQLP